MDKQVELDTCTERYAKTLSRMIQIETVSVPGVRNKEKFDRFHNLLEELFPHLFAVLEVEDFDGSLLLRWPGKSKKDPLLLMSHHDVVDASSGNWLHEPFSGDIADGKIWGRGTLDTKNNLWAMLQAAEELTTEGFVPERDVFFESACTEETDGSGADKITRALQERGMHFFMTLDEGGMVTPGGPLGQMDRLFAQIGVAEKAMVNLKFTARSRGGHASTPGKNTPLIRLGRFMAAVEDGNLFTARMSEVTEETLKRLADDQDETTKFLFQHARALQPLLQQHMPGIFGVEGASLKTTIAFTMCHGSNAANVLPQEAYVIGNMRVSHHQGAEDSIRKISELAKQFDIETEVIQPPVESTVTNYKGEAFQLLESVIREFFPDATILPYLMTGGSDSRFFSRVCDSCLRFAPFTCDMQQVFTIHGVNENLDLSTLKPAVNFYRRLIQLV